MGGDKLDQLSLSLNIESDPSRSVRVKEATAKRKAAEESLDDAWARIFEMRLTEIDRKRLIEVKKAMEAGEIARSDADKYTKRGVPKRFSKAEALRMWRRLQEAQKDRKLREMVENTPDNYHLITTEAQIERLVYDLLEETIIAVDTETTGVDVYEDKIVGISFTLPKRNYHVYIPVAHDEGEQLPRSFVLEMLRDVLESEQIGKVLHNAKFDIHMFLRHGVRVRGLKWDTMVAMHLLNENEESFALKNLAPKYLKVPADTYETLFGKVPFNSIPLDVALVYAAKDTDITWRLYEFQRTHFERLPNLKNIYEKIENPLIDICVDMERTGFVIDKEYAKDLGEQLRVELSEIERELQEHFGDINFNSPAQLSELFFNRLKLDKHLPKGAKLSTDVKTLKQLAPHHVGIAKLLQYREKTKLLGTYIEALPKQIKSDGRIHGTFNQASTVTGRFASREPNLQNIPGYARKMFVAPPGMVLLSGDFSQQEPRMLAHFSQEPVLIEAYRAGNDLYSTAAAEMFGLPIAECGDGSSYRNMMKTGILAVMYGTSSKTLAEQLGITQSEAEDFIKQFFAKYKRVKAWIDGNIRFARKHGYVEMLGGRKRRLPGIKSKDRWERLRAERQCTNAIIQGSAAIQTKLTMIKLDELCKRKGWQMAMTVHDEIGAYVPETITIEEVREFEAVMLNTVKLRVPNKTDIEISRRWGEGKSVEEWFHEN